MAYSADPDQLASSEANWSGTTLFAKQGISGFSRTRLRVHLKKKKKERKDDQRIHQMVLMRCFFFSSDFLYWLIVLGFNDTSTLEGHFVSSPRKREKRDRRESRGDEREGQGRKRNRNESEETEEIKTFPLYPYPLYLYKDSRPCPTVSQYQLDAPVM